MVNDEEDLLPMFVRMLEDAGLRVVTAADAERALQLVEKQPDIQLLFTDVMLPGMNGVELAMALRKRIPGIKVILTTGFGEATPESLGQEPKSIHLLAKPFTREDLLAQLAEMLAD